MATKHDAQRGEFLLDHQIDEFFIDRKSRNLTHSTLRWYEESLSTWRDFLITSNVDSTEGVTPNHLRRFILQLHRRRNEGGVVHVFGAIRAFLKWYENEFASEDWKNPLYKVKAPKRTEIIQEPIDLPDFQALLGTCDVGTFTGDRDRAMLLFLLDTGVRKKEFVDLLIRDVNLRTGDVLIRQGKGGKSRVVFAGARTRRALRNYLAHRDNPSKEESLWITRQGEGITYHGFRQAIRRRAIKANIKEPGIHEFRRAFAVNYLRNGGDIHTLQRMLGHADLRVIHRYLALVQDDLRTSHQKHGPVDNLF
ncbi:tyrosine-type recombinase/integrase [Chloroflexi bacterium TSY]|nr:tyrosine-type recombinase/integrase [Chloroflexi bacterium TSY]